MHQDAKHLINRVIEQTSKCDALYTQYSSKFHSAVVGAGKQTVRSRNGKYYEIPLPLDTGDVIWARLEKLTEQYKILSSALFLPGFDAVFLEQKKHIVDRKCLEEIYVMDADGVRRHYYEREDGDFLLYRGTNRNENTHGRLGHIILLADNINILIEYILELTICGRRNVERIWPSA